MEVRALDLKRKAAEQIVANVGSVMPHLRTTMAQPLTEQLPRVAVEAVSANVDRLESIYKKARLVQEDPSANSLPEESWQDVSKLVNETKKAASVLNNIVFSCENRLGV